MVPRTSTSDRPQRKTYPKRFQDRESLFPDEAGAGIQLREYPARPGHHYGHNQNARGHERNISPGGTELDYDPRAAFQFKDK
ncbi:hypothetical protein DV737_g4689, partial [Chaetothyriales sp. CBS 132003]